MPTNARQRGWAYLDQKRLVESLENMPGVFEYWQAGKGHDLRFSGGLNYVAAWRGQKRGISLEQATEAKQPVLYMNPAGITVAGRFRKNPVVDFTAASGQFLTADKSLDISSPYAVFVVMEYDLADTLGGTLGERTTKLDIHETVVAGPTLQDFTLGVSGEEDVGLVGMTDEASVPGAYLFVVDEVQGVVARSAMWLGGENNGVMYDGSSFGATTFDEALIVGGVAPNFLDGRIAEIAFIKGRPSIDIINRLGRYANHKYGTPWSTAYDEFLPSAIEDLVAWFRADKGVSKRGSTDYVSGWEDLSSHGNDLAQATEANQPTFATAGLGGKPAICFLRSLNQFMQGALAANAGQPNVVIAVVDWTNEHGSTYEVLCDGGDGVASVRQAFFCSQYASKMVMYAGSSANAKGSLSAYEGARIVALVWNGASSKLYNAGTPNDLAGSPGASIANSIILGTEYSHTHFSTVRFAEYMLFDRLLTGAEINRICSYLAARYGLTWNAI